ncbi:MAG TPA: hypothetical protein PK360_09925 [bacterium]|nr:hypothetical protein [bacterium]
MNFKKSIELKSMVDESLPRLDRSAFSIVPLEESDRDLEYWLNRPAAERVAAVEWNRRMVYGHDRAASRLQRFLEIAELEPR